MLPNDIVIEKNYPNPFNPKTSIQFSLETQQTISIKILDLNGHLVKSIIRDLLPAGNHTVQWNGLDQNNAPVSSGVYIFSLQAKGKRLSQKMILLK
jgi:flagellar hook assembly protein FlgD